MNIPLHMIRGASAASVLILTTLGQEQPIPSTGRPAYATDESVRLSRFNRLNEAVKASDVLGMSVNNYQSEKLGKVEELIVDLESGRLVEVILSTGGFLGIGETLNAIPPGALHYDSTNAVLHLDADKAKLKNGAKFEMAKWAECCSSNQVFETYRYYGEDAALPYLHRGDVVWNTSQNQAVNRVGKDSTETGSRGLENRSAGSNSGLNQVQRASKLIGTSVKNMSDQTLGKIENLLVDMPSGRIVAAVVSSGGFLGMGDELSAVPPTALHWTADQGTLQLDATKESLTSAPHFKANQWPDFAQATYSEGIYRAYRVEPYFTTNSTAGPDNTALNVRDRGDRTLTPTDQGNSQADLRTTADIRKAIVAGKNMSVNARNVKIITQDGHVTLRGPVDTAAEKNAIGEIANGIASTENVSNQLEVK